MRRNPLRDAEIQHFLMIPSDSEDGQDSSGADTDDDIEILRATINRICEESGDSQESRSPSPSHEFPDPLPCTPGIIPRSTSLSPVIIVDVDKETNPQLILHSGPNVVNFQPGKSVSKTTLKNQSKTSCLTIVSPQPSTSGLGKKPVISRSKTAGLNVVSPQPCTSGLGKTSVVNPSKTSSSSKTSKTKLDKKKTSAATVKRKKRHFVWKKKPFQVPSPCQFTGDEQLKSPIIELETPLQCFLHFFDDDLLGHIVEETRKFSIQKDPSKPFIITKFELRKYLGICMLMGLAPLPNIRMYWGVELGLPLVAQTMTVNNFEKIREHLHFNDNSLQPRSGTPGHDRLHKIRPILETLRKKCSGVPKRQTLSVDEQMCATKASNMLRQYLPNKPHKWGYKLLVLCDDRGFAYDFEVYSGMENDPALRYQNEPDLGASANIVVRLARAIPRGQNYKLFFDNYYTCPELISYLAKEGIHSLGTINKGRLGKDLPIPSVKDLKNRQKNRGYSEEWVAVVDGTDVVTLMWYDNKPVVLSSSFTGQQPIQKIRRFCRKQKKYIEIDCPQIVLNYNKHMGGVDLLDSYLGKDKIKMRTRKWYLRLFYHLIDVMVVNSWLLYKRVGEQTQIPTPLKLREFKLEVAKSLCMCGPQMNKKKGRPSLSTSEDAIAVKRQKLNVAILPTRDVRLDRIDHLPSWNTKRQRCKYPGCRGKSYISCDKCKVELCLNKDNKCFSKFHA